MTLYCAVEYQVTNLSLPSLSFALPFPLQDTWSQDYDRREEYRPQSVQHQPASSSILTSSVPPSEGSARGLDEEGRHVIGGVGGCQGPRHQQLLYFYCSLHARETHYRIANTYKYRYKYKYKYKSCPYCHYTIPVHILPSIPAEPNPLYDRAHKSSTLHYTTPYCTVLHCTVLHCTLLHPHRIHISPRRVIPSQPAAKRDSTRLYYAITSHHALSYLILPYLVLSCTMLHYSVLSYGILSYTVVIYLILSNHIQYCTILSFLIHLLNKTLLFNSILFYSILYHLLFYTTPTHTFYISQSD